MIAPDGIQVGVPVSLKGPPPGTPLAEVGADFADLPQPKEVRTATGKTTAVSLIASLVLTHRRSDPRYRAMTTSLPACRSARSGSISISGGSWTTTTRTCPG